MSSKERKVHKMVEPFLGQSYICYSVGETLFFDENKEVIHYWCDFMNTTAGNFEGVYRIGGKIKPISSEKTDTKIIGVGWQLYKSDQYLLFWNGCLPVFYYNPSIEDEANDNVPEDVDQQLFISEALVVGDDIAAKLLRIEDTEDNLSGVINQFRLSEELAKQFYLVDLFDTLGYERPVIGGRS